MAIYEATGADAYRLANDLNEMFIDNDPGSFNRVDLLFMILMVTVLWKHGSLRRMVNLLS